MTLNNTDLSLGRKKATKRGHEVVQKLPRNPDRSTSYWIESPNGRNELTHSLFRFPAKFHPPIVRWALSRYAKKGSLVLDPFTGSGTVQVEALTRGISSVGFDVDPLAHLVASVKTRPLNPNMLENTLEQIKLRIAPFSDMHAALIKNPPLDLSNDEYEIKIASLRVPNIFNIKHWFRKYVIVELALLRDSITQTVFDENERQFFRACFAAIIRRVSNADPEPVSGLEVTTRQAKKNLTRRISVFDEFWAKTAKEIQGMKQLWNATTKLSAIPDTQIHNGNSTELLGNWIEQNDQRFSVVITSPPYCRAVEYSRRHQLELFWLDFVNNPAEHTSLTHTYIGRNHVRLSDWNDNEVNIGIHRLDKLISRISKVNEHKARTVKHYFISMDRWFAALSPVLKRSGVVVCVIGDSVCCDQKIATSDFIEVIGSQYLSVENRFSYAIRNHHMQYGLWNGDGIKKEHVIVFRNQ